MRRVFAAVLALFMLAGSLSGAPAARKGGDDPAQLIYRMEQGGAPRRQAFWYAFQSRQYFLLRRVVKYLHDSSDAEDHRMILRIMEVMGPGLETHIPGWYDLLDDYMQPGVPDDLLIRCMKMAVLFKEHRMVFALNRMLEHPAFEIRMEAIRSLVAMENDNVVPVLIRFLKTSDVVLVIYGLQGASVLGDSRFQPFVQELLDHSNKSVRIYALRTLSDLKVEGDVAYLITGRFAREPNAEVRREIIRLIGKRMIAGQQYLVVRAMADPSPLVREAGYSTALQLRTGMFAREISQALLREEDPARRRHAMHCLVGLSAGDPSSALGRILRADSDAATRALSARGIAAIRDRSQSAALIQAVREDRERMVRREAASSLIGLVDAAQASLLVEMILDDRRDTEERLLLLRALQKCGNAEVLRDLRQKAGPIRDAVLRHRIEESP